MGYLFFFYCFAELWLLLTIGGELGVITTILWFLVSAIIGINLLRLIGFQQVNQHRKNFGTMAIDDSVSTTVIKALGAIALIIPGFFSDVTGLLLLFSPFRTLIFRTVSKCWRKAFSTPTHSQTDSHFNKQSNNSGDSTKRTIEGEFRRD